MTLHREGGFSNAYLPPTPHIRVPIGQGSMLGEGENCALSGHLSLVLVTGNIENLKLVNMS